MRILAKNKRARADYAIVDTYDAGIVLQGHEVKAIKMDHVSVKEAIIRFKGQELFVLNMQVPLYSKTHPNLAPDYITTQARKLLLSKKELTKIYTKVHKTGLAIVPLMIYEAKNRRVKLQLGVGKLMRKVEKKQVLKERDQKRQMNRAIKNMGL